MSVSGDLDMEMLLIIPFSFGAASSLGIIQGDILPFLDLSQSVYSQGGIDFTAGRIIALLSLIAVFVNRDDSVLDTQGVDLFLVYATIGLVVAPPLVPAFAETLAEQPANLLAFTIQGLGFTLISWVN